MGGKRPAGNPRNGKEEEIRKELDKFLGTKTGAQR